MMQDRFEEEFDLMVRSLAQNATEKPRRRVWSSLRSALGQGSAVLWRSLAAVAVAAGLAVIVVVNTLPAGKGAAAPKDTTIAQAAAAPEMAEMAEPAVPGAASAAVQDAPLRRASKPARTSSSFVPASATFVPAAVPAAVPAPADKAANAGSQEPDAASSVAQAAEKPAGDRTSVSTDKVDVFALMDAKDRVRGRRHNAPALLMGMQLGTNDRAASGFNRVRLAAPPAGSVATKKISEAGESTFDIPLSFGIGVRAYFSDRWAVGTGITYTRLGRRFEGVYTETNGSGVTTNIVKGDFTNIQQYLGIPLTLSYDIVSNDAVSVYGFTGAAIERAISNRFRIPGASSVKGEISGVQLSASIGFGLDFKLSDHLGLYVDPAIVYYFDGNQPKSIRTQQQLQGRMEAGFRFDF